MYKWRVMRNSIVGGVIKASIFLGWDFMRVFLSLPKSHWLCTGMVENPCVDCSIITNMSLLSFSNMFRNHIKTPRRCFAKLCPYSVFEHPIFKNWKHETQLSNMIILSWDPFLLYKYKNVFWNVVTKQALSHWSNGYTYLFYF